MTSGDVEAHPIVAALAASMKQEGTSLQFPESAFEKARTALRSTSGDEVVVHLLALGVKTHRIAGPAAERVLLSLALLIGERLGSAQAAADRFAAAGLSHDAAALLGTAVAARGPEAKKPPAPQVKARRGLS